MDFTFDSVELTFSSSLNMSCVAVPTTQDEVYENDEMFSGHLSTTDLQVVFQNRYTTVVILDDDKG